MHPANDFELDIDFIDFDENSEEAVNPYGPPVEGVWVNQSRPITVDGVDWWSVAGGMSDEYVRIENGQANGNPHIVPVYGHDRYGDYLFEPPNMEYDDVDLQWVPCWPSVWHGPDGTEYDVDYGDPYDTFEEAVRAGLSKADARRSV